MKTLKNLVMLSMLSCVSFSFAATCPAYPNNNSGVSYPAPQGYKGNYSTVDAFYAVVIEHSDDTKAYRISCFYTGTGSKIAGAVFNVSSFNVQGPWTVAQDQTHATDCGTRAGGSITSCEFNVTA